MKFFFILVLMLLIGCGDKSSSRVISFPTEVDTLFQRSCATAGCHLPDEHDLEKTAAISHLGGELDLSSWSGLFKGSHDGAAVIPFSSSNSHMIDHITGIAQPRMPPSEAPFFYDTLLSAEVDLLKAWIDEGAPGAGGHIAFSGARRRLFTTNQVTDEVSVIDYSSLLTMRVFKVGDRPQNESPHGVQVTKDGRYFFVSMIATGEVFKYDARNGEFLAKIALTDPVALIELSADDSKLYVTTNFQVNSTGQPGSISAVRTSDMTLIKPIPVGISPHGISLSRDGKLLYVTAVYSDRIYVINTVTDSVVTHFDVADDVTPTAKYEPYHIGLSPKNSSGFEDFLFISCRKSGEVRIFQHTKAGGLDVFSYKQNVLVGSTTNSKPIQLDVTPDGNKIYVANSNDSSITVINKTGNTFAFGMNIVAQAGSEPGEFHRLSQPNGVTISRDGRYVFVTNRNKSSAVPPHHGGAGGPGLLTVIDVATNAIVKTIELPPDCYSATYSDK